MMKLRSVFAQPHYLFGVSILGIVLTSSYAHAGQGILLSEYEKENKFEHVKIASQSSHVFAETIRNAVLNYPGASVGLSLIKQADADLASTDGAYIPDLAAGYALSRRDLSGTKTNADGFVFSAQQLLFDSGKSFALVDAAKERIKRSEYEHLQDLDLLTLQFIDTYQKVLLESELVDVAQGNLNVHEEYLTITQDRFDAGTGAEGDRLIARSRLSDARSRLIEAQARLVRAKASFEELYGYLPNTSKMPATERVQLSLNPSKDDVLGMVHQSPKYQSIRAELLARVKDLTAAERARFPELVLDVTSREDSAGSGRDVLTEVTGMFDLDLDGKKRAKIDLANARLWESQLTLKETELAAVRDYQFTLAEIVANEERIISAKLARDAYKANVNAARERFTIGRLNTLDVLEAQKDFLISQEELLAIQQKALLKRYELLTQTGSLAKHFGIYSSELSRDVR